MKRISALYTAGMIVVAGAVGCVAAVDASSQPVPQLNGSCIGPLEVLQAAQAAEAAEGIANGFTVNGEYVPIENGLTEPQLYATTKGCAPDGSSGDSLSIPGSPTTTVPGGADTTTTEPGTAVPPSTTTTAPATTTTVAPTTTTTRRPIVCRVWRWHHWVLLHCHRG